MGNFCMKPNSSHFDKNDGNNNIDGISESDSEDRVVVVERRVKKKIDADEVERSGAFDGTTLMFLSPEEKKNKLREWMELIQKHNLGKMKMDLQKDVNGFVLNNLLLSIQFYDNFETATREGAEFKLLSESEKNEELSGVVSEGVIHGERKVCLLTGLPHVINQNLVYSESAVWIKEKRVKSGGILKSSLSKQNSGPTAPSSPFVSHSLMPLDYVLTWDNLEVYKEVEWHELVDSEYSSAKGSPSIRRFCLEEHDEKNNIPKGFGSLRAVDPPPLFRPIHPVPNGTETPNGSGNYVEDAIYSTTYEKLGEVRTDSDLSSSENDDEKGEIVKDKLTIEEEFGFETKTSESLIIEKKNGKNNSGVNRKELSPNFYDPRNRASSSVMSEEIHAKWREVELKELGAFKVKKREGGTEPVPDSCFQKVMIEIESESEEEEESDEDSDDSDAKREKILRKERDRKFEEKTYLNSLNFSSEFCSEFTHLLPPLGLTIDSESNSMVLGTSIYLMTKEGSGSYFHTKTFTPALYSKNWPQKSLLWWTRKMIDDKWDVEMWPKSNLVTNIEESGCFLYPLGSRSIHASAATNVTQTLLWQLNFQKAESMLLDSLESVHWRSYIFSSILFRAFIAPLGPLGVDLSHFRTILFHMCHEEYLSWNFEEPGSHVRTILTRFYDSLSKGKLFSFFIVGQNLLKNVPVQNLRKVQAELNKLRGNLLINFIFALRNLIDIKGKDFYPLPDFKLLYAYLTKEQKDLLIFINPNLPSGRPEDDAENEKKRKKKRNRRNNPDISIILDGKAIDEDYEKVFNKSRQNVDVVQIKSKRKRELWEAKQHKLQMERDAAEAAAVEKTLLPAQRKNSLDLSLSPKKYSDQRLSLIIKFFIRHFIKMGAKSFVYKSYAQASMYVQHTENLLTILKEMMNQDIDPDTQKYINKVRDLRAEIGEKMLAYIEDKINSSSEAEVPKSPKIEPVTGFNLSPQNPPESNSSLAPNWDFRKLPQVPLGVSKSLSFNSFSQSMAKSLQALQSTIDEEEPKPTIKRVTSIKFIDRIPRPVLKEDSSSSSWEPDEDNFKTTIPRPSLLTRKRKA